MADGYETDLVFGVFHGEDDFRNAVDELEDLDFHTGDVTIVMQDEKRAQELADETGTKAGEGAATGAIVGGIAGVLAGITAAVIPGGIIVAGPAAVGLGLTGAAAGGVVGALIGLGIPEEEARHWEERVVGGDILVAVPSFDSEEVLEIFSRHNASDIDMVSVTPSDRFQYNPWISEHTRNTQMMEGRT